MSTATEFKEIPDPEAQLYEDMIEPQEPFPMECLPGVAGDIAREIARVSTSQNEPLAAASVLGVLSAALGAGIEISTGGERVTRGNIFVMAIAESGTGKGEAYSIAARPFEEAERHEIEMFDMHEKPGLVAELAIADKRAKRLCEAASKEEDPDAKRMTVADYKRAEAEKAEIQKKIDSAPRWKVGDVTKESLAVVMSGQPGEAVASMSSEARGVITIVQGRYGKNGGDEDFYCSAYSGDSITVDRISRGRVSLGRPCLSILWMIQPDAARRAFEDEGLTDSGLLPRFLLFDAKADPVERTEPPAPIPAKITGDWKALVTEITSAYRNREGDPLRATADPGAITVLGDYEREGIRQRRAGGELRDVAPYVARWAENAWRLALVLHGAGNGRKAHSTPLSAATAKQAVKAMRWFADRQLEVMGAGRHERLRKRLSALMTILADRKEGITLRDLRRSHSFDPEEVKQLVEAFPTMIEIVVKKPETGRPSPTLMAKGR